ncbi:MAG: YetF domain-containing protein [Acidimicrobiia bacterium]
MGTAKYVVSHVAPPSIAVRLMWFDNWSSVLRIVVVGTLGYIALISLLRVSGKRTLSKMNAFDFVVTITLGSVFGGLLLNDAVSLTEGVTAIALLVVLQWVVSSIYVRSTNFEKLVKGEPQLLFDRGRFLDRTLRRERVTREEVQAAMRASNVVNHERALAVLETDGSVTVIAAQEQEEPLAVEGVRGVQRTG